jgi:predicted RNA-binding Zn-ribbon protein involved in translation (DUF1610 family)
MDENKSQENQYCKSCGNEIEKDADFCPACGEQTRKSEITYVKANRGGFGAGRVIAILLGGFLMAYSTKAAGTSESITSTLRQAPRY